MAGNAEFSSPHMARNDRSMPAGRQARDPSGQRSAESRPQAFARRVQGVSDHIQIFEVGEVFDRHGSNGYPGIAGARGPGSEPQERAQHKLSPGGCEFACRLTDRVHQRLASIAILRMAILARRAHQFELPGRLSSVYLFDPEQIFQCLCLRMALLHKFRQPGRLTLDVL